MCLIKVIWWSGKWNIVLQFIDILIPLYGFMENLDWGWKWVGFEALNYYGSAEISLTALQTVIGKCY